MRITKEQLKQIIKEEMKSVLEDIARPEFPGEELPQGAELDQAFNTVTSDKDEKIKNVKERIRRAYNDALSSTQEPSIAHQFGDLYQTYLDEIAKDFGLQPGMDADKILAAVAA